VGVSCATPSIDNDDNGDDNKEEANDDEETEDDEKAEKHILYLQVCSLFGVLMPKEEKIVLYLLAVFSFSCVMDSSCTHVGHGWTRVLFVFGL
jgi:hypothetical protein